MEHDAEIDVSLEESSVCILDATGRLCARSNSNPGVLQVGTQEAATLSK